MDAGFSVVGELRGRGRGTVRKRMMVDKFSNNESMIGKMKTNVFYN